MNKEATQFLRDRHIIEPHKNDLIMRFDNGDDESLIELLTEFSRLQIKEHNRWMLIEDKLPTAQDNLNVLEPHLTKLEIQSRKYGRFRGFYHEGKFMRDYATQILDVVSWRYERP